MVEICSGTGLNPLLLRELCRANPTQAAVEPDFVVVLPPFSNSLSGLGQSQEPLLVQALVPELAVETLDVAVLHGPTRLRQDRPHAVCAGPGHEGPAYELRTVAHAEYPLPQSQHGMAGSVRAGLQSSDHDLRRSWLCESGGSCHESFNHDHVEILCNIHCHP